MIGRRVKSAWYGLADGVIIQWEPYGAAMTDVLVETPDGRRCWYASSSLTPLSGGPLPCRREAQERRRLEMIHQLEACRAQHIADWRKPWPGCEFAKALVGRMIDGALADLHAKGSP